MENNDSLRGSHLLSPKQQSWHQLTAPSGLPVLWKTSNLSWAFTVGLGRLWDTTWSFPVEDRPILRPRNSRKASAKVLCKHTGGCSFRSVGLVIFLLIWQYCICSSVSLGCVWLQCFWGDGRDPRRICIEYTHTLLHVCDRFFITHCTWQNVYALSMVAGLSCLVRKTYVLCIDTFSLTVSNLWLAEYMDLDSECRGPMVLVVA